MRFYFAVNCQGSLFDVIRERHLQKGEQVFVTLFLKDLKIHLGIFSFGRIWMFKARYYQLTTPISPFF